jgi:hypothetical protein
MRAAPKLDRRTVTKNIEAVLKLEEEDERRLSALHRISHKVGWFVGTIYFVILQLLTPPTASWGCTLVGNNTLKMPLNTWYAAINAIAIIGEFPWK